MLQSSALKVPLSAGHLLEWPVEFPGGALLSLLCGEEIMLGDLPGGGGHS